MKVLVDTNILVYALDEASPFYNKTVGIFEKIKNNEFQPVVAQQNILEAQNTLIKDYKLDKNEVLESIFSIIYSFEFIVINPQINTLKIYKNILDNNTVKRNDIFDLYLAATMISNSVKRIYTGNTKDFQGIKDIEAVNPL